ncbi:hypothetical protein ACTA71_004940 [Dictyostelium dimigraforme]
MFKNILNKSNSLLKQYSIVNNRSFSTLSSGSQTNGFSNLISKQYRFNLDGSLKSTNTLNIKNILSNETEIKPILLIKDLNLNEININYNNKIVKEEETALEVSSVLIKRRKMMSKHKQRKLRKRTRALKKRLGKI